MKIVVTGATGFIGRELLLALKQHGHEVVVLSRNPEEAKKKLPYPCSVFKWNPTQESAPLEAFQNVDGVIHLLGERVAGGLWTDERKKAIFESRIRGTENLVKTLSNLKKKPEVFVSASAIGFYGNRPEETLTETSLSGTGFLAHTCKYWEKEIFKTPALSEVEGEDLGIRTVAIRIGIVMGQGGGILEKVAPIFQKGLGSVLGNGRQVMAWIHVKDLVNIFIHALERKNIQGPVNGVAPFAVTNEEFSKSLGKVLCRPVLFKTPAFILKILLGEVSTLMLESQKISSEKIQSLGFQFQYPRSEDALKNILGEKR